MKSIINKIIYVILSILSITFFLMWMIRGYNDNNKISKLEKELSNCVNSPIRIDTIHDSITIYSNRIIHPKPKIITDTIYQNNVDICRNYYDSIYEDGKLKIHYQIQTNGCDIESLQFPDVVVPKDVIYYTKTVDTCFNKKPEYKPKNHYGIELDIKGNKDNILSGLGCDVFWSFKDKWGIKGGIEYIDPTKTLYGNVGVIIYIK